MTSIVRFVEFLTIVVGGVLLYTLVSGDDGMLNIGFFLAIFGIALNGGLLLLHIGMRAPKTVSTLGLVVVLLVLCGCEGRL